MTGPEDEGWAWFGPRQDGARPADDTEMADTARAFARCFAGRNGKRALAHLQGLTTGRFLGPEATDATLRHLEGQRHLVAWIQALIERGRAGG